MTGADHYREAERHLSAASHLTRPDGPPVAPLAAAHRVALAQAHAILALAAATALLGPVAAGGYTDDKDLSAWRAAAGEQPEWVVTVEDRTPRRGDHTEAWLKAARDRVGEGSPFRALLDDLVDNYRLHADYAVPLNEPTPVEGGDTRG